MSDDLISRKALIADCRKYVKYPPLQEVFETIIDNQATADVAVLNCYRLQTGERIQVYAEKMADEEANEPQENEESYQHTIYLLNQEVQRLNKLLTQQPIVRSVDEIAKRLTFCHCNDCPMEPCKSNSTCIENWENWLTKKEVE